MLGRCRRRWWQGCSRLRVMVVSRRPVRAITRGGAEMRCMTRVVICGIEQVVPEAWVEMVRATIPWGKIERQGWRYCRRCDHQDCREWRERLAQAKCVMDGWRDILRIGDGMPI